MFGNEVLLGSKIDVYTWKFTKIFFWWKNLIQFGGSMPLKRGVICHKFA